MSFMVVVYLVYLENETGNPNRLENISRTQFGNFWRDNYYLHIKRALG